MRLRDSDYIYCRTFLHAWDQIPDNGGNGLRHFVESRSTARIASRCIRCGTVRLEAWNKITGERLGAPQYIYPWDYRLDNPNDRSLKKYRREFLRRSEIVATHVERRAATRKPATIRKGAKKGKIVQMRKVS